MRNLAIVLVLVAGCAGRTRSDLGTPAPNAMPEEWFGAFTTVVEGRALSAQAGDWLIERDEDGGVRAHHLRQRVSGGALAEIDDSVLEGRVYAALGADNQLRAHDIGVTAEDGVIILTGSVDGTRTASRAMRVALSTNGVGEVRSRLTWNE